MLLGGLSAIFMVASGIALDTLAVDMPKVALGLGKPSAPDIIRGHLDIAATTGHPLWQMDLERGRGPAHMELPVRPVALLPAQHRLPTMSPSA